MEKAEILQNDDSDLSRSLITPEIIYRLDSFFEFMPPHDFRDYLIELYHNYIMHEHASLPYNFRQLAEGMNIFFDFLKFADEECKYQRSEAPLTTPPCKTNPHRPSLHQTQSPKCEALKCSPKQL